MYYFSVKLNLLENKGTKDMAATRISSNSNEMTVSTSNKDIAKEVNSKNNAITITDDQKIAMVQEKAQQLGIALQTDDVKKITVSLKDNFRTQAQLTKSINGALVAFQQKLNKFIEQDNQVTTEALVFLRHQQNKKNVKYLEDLNSDLDDDCQKWQDIADYTKDLFDVDLGENNNFNLG